jgi:Aldehyde dehydrogenase family
MPDGGGAKRGAAKPGPAKAGPAKAGPGKAAGKSAERDAAKRPASRKSATKPAQTKTAVPVAEPARPGAATSAGKLTGIGTATSAGKRTGTGAAAAAGKGRSAQARPARRAASPGPAPGSGDGGRIGVRKTYKLFIGGAFPRSESGRSYQVTGPDGAVLANAAWASRKDVRDAVVAARSAFGRWSGATAYNRGQVLYRVAELLEGRGAQFAAEIVQNEGLDLDAAEDQVARAIDRWVWYAGWTDKISQVAGAANPVAGPYFNFSVPEPAGVIAVIAPPESSLLGLVSVLAPVIATGNTAIVVASETRPLPAVTLTEVLATSDVPAGVVNVLSGRSAELVPVLAAHMDVNAIDLSGVAVPGRAEFERLAADNVKRVFAADEDWARPPGLRRLLAFLETKTVWHPVGI